MVGLEGRKEWGKRKRIVKKNHEYKTSLEKKKCDLHRPHLSKRKCVSKSKKLLLELLHTVLDDNTLIVLANLLASEVEDAVVNSLVSLNGNTDNPRKPTYMKLIQVQKPENVLELSATQIMYPFGGSQE